MTSPPASHLVVSGFGDDTGGGLYRVDPEGGAAERLDDLAATGLWVREGRLARVLRVPADVSGPCEIVEHDHAGVRSYLRVEGITDPHDLLWDAGRWVVTSSDRNSVSWLDPSGEVVEEWRPSLVPDAWHVNCLLPYGGGLLLSAFGRFDESRQWSGDAARGAGLLFDLATGADVLTGLTHPHTPRSAPGGGWVVCESLDGDVVELGPDGAERRRVHLGGYTRGLAPAAGGGWHVGVSGRRQTDSFAAVVTVDASWQPVGQIELPCREVYDLVHVGDALLAGLRRGADVSPARRAAREGGQPAMPALEPDECAVTVEVADLPATAGEVVAEVPCRITNRGGATWVTGPPHPIHLAYRWYAPGSDGAFTDGLRTVLPRDVRPGESLTVPLRLGPPPGPGAHRLVVTLVQEGVRWFDEVDAAHRWEGGVEPGAR